MLVIATLYSVINPIHEGTDELRHYRFIQYIIQNKSLPVQGQEDCRSQSHHPPLFYMMAAVVSAGVDTGEGVCVNGQANPFWGYRQWEVGTDNKNQYIHPPSEQFPWQGQARAANLARLVNVVLGGLVVIVTWLTARLVWPKNRWMAIGAIPLVAFLPQFLYMSGTLNNDVIAALAGGSVCLVCVLLINRPGPLNNPLKWGIIFGAAYSLALMSKFNLAPFGLPLGLVIIYKTLMPNTLTPSPSPEPGEGSQNWQSFFTAGFAFVGTTAVLAGWWFLRNQLLYGEPTGFRILTELWGVREASSSWGLLWIELPGIWSTFIGRFGFGQIPLPALVYQISWGLTFLAMFGIGFNAFWHWFNQDRLSGNPDAPIRPHLLLLGLVALIAVVVVFAYVLVSPAGAMGRFLFPGLPAFALLIFWGLTLWPKLLGWNFDRQLAIGLNVVMVWVGLWALFMFLQPAYAQPNNLAEGESAVATSGNVIFFEPFARLLNSSVDSLTVTPGDTITLDLTWEVASDPFGDFYFFVHLIDGETGELIAQRDTHPATGKFPMTQWTAGYRFAEQINIEVPQTAHPGQVDLRIGFYAPVEGYRLGISDQFGGSLGDSYLVTTLDLIERQGPYPNHQSINFDGRARLRGYEFSDRSPAGDEPLTVTFYWDLLDITTLKHTEALVLMYWSDGTVLEDRLPFSAIIDASNNGSTGIDKRTVQMDQLPLDGYSNFSLILIDQFTGERVNMVTARGNWIDDELSLPSVRPK